MKWEKEFGIETKKKKGRVSAADGTKGYGEVLNEFIVGNGFKSVRGFSLRARDDEKGCEGFHSTKLRRKKLARKLSTIMIFYWD